MKKYILLIVTICFIQNINAQIRTFLDSTYLNVNLTKTEKEIINDDTLFTYISDLIPLRDPISDTVLTSKPISVGRKSARSLVVNYPSVSIDKNKGVGSIPIESNVTNGALIYNIPIEVTQSSTSFQPSISIAYNSMSENGIAGFGWNIGGLSCITITNSTYYHDNGNVEAAKRINPYYALDGIRLIKTVTQGNPTKEIIYETEQGLIKVVSYIPSGKYYFEVFYPDGRKAIYGYETNVTPKISYPLTKIVDNYNNYITYLYTELDNNYIISDIKYGINSSVQIGALKFYYKDRTDSRDFYIDGVAVRLSKLLTKIETYDKTLLLRSYNLGYEFKEYNLLTSVSCKVDDNNEFNPLLFYYGSNRPVEGTLGTSGVISAFLNQYFANEKVPDLILNRGRFNNLKLSDGLIAYPNIPTYGIVKKQTSGGKVVALEYGSLCNPNQELLCYPDIGSWTVNPQIMLAEKGFQSLSAVDINGDGNDELLKINYIFESDHGKVIITKYDKEMKGATSSFLIEGAFKIGKLRSPFPRVFVYGDFNGDGKVELLTLYGNKTPGDIDNRDKSRATLINLEKMSIIYDGMVPPVDYLSGETVFVLDFDGDGKSEYCALKKDGIYIYSFNNASFTQIAYSNYISSETLSGTHKREMLIGDINGDGKMDILCSPEYNISGRYANQWLCLFSTGTDIVKSYQAINSTFYNDKTKFLLQDINGDRLPDLLVKDGTVISAYLNKNGQISNKVESGKLTVDDKVHFIAANLGDGYISSGRTSHLLTIKDAFVNSIQFTKNEAQERLLTVSVDGLGIMNIYDYSNLSEKRNYITNASSSVAYPYNVLLTDMNVINSVSTYIGNKYVASNSYSYYDAILNRQGRGFCGFSKIKISDNIRSISVTQEFDPTRFGVMIGIDSPITSSASTYNVSVAANKIAKVLLTSTTKKDKLNDNAITSSYTYDYYGNRIGEIVDYGNNIKVTTSNQYNNYTGAVYKLGELVSQEIKSERDGKLVKTKTLISYNANYLPTSKKTYYDDKLTSEEAYYYNSKFQLDSLRTKAYSSPSWLSTKYTYDVYGRIATETDALGLKITNTYNTKGLLASVKNHKGHETKYEYDPWGRNKKSIFPDGTTESTTLEWAKTDSELGMFDPNKNSGTLKINTSPPSGTITACESIILQPGFSYNSAKGSLRLNTEPNTCATIPTTNGVSTSYLVTTIATGVPTTKVYYDALGREVRKGEVRFDGKYLYTDYIYNNKGKLQKTSLPFKGSAPTLWNEYSYDSYDRIISLAYASGKKDTYSYAKNKVTSLVDGISTTKTYNAAGELISVTDAAGTITYTLRADGQPSSITAPGNVTTRFEYDAYGRQTKIIDPSAGTKTFAYDIAGNIAKETDANNKSINYTYDKYNRLTKEEIVGEQIISSVYNSDGLLTAETSTNNTSKTYTYDNLLRVSTQRETVVDGKWLEKQYTYSGGNTASTLYTSQSGTIATENYSYSYGHLSEIKLNNSTSIWKLTAENNLGMSSQAITGGLTRTYGYNAYGLPTMRSATNGGTAIQNFTYEFDVKTGNLTWRKDNTRNLQENFTYDNLNRLASFGGNTITYDVKGNITNHTGVGKFEYLRTDKPYAITDVTPYGNAIPLRNQKITYNAQMRPLSITENNYVATFAYNSGGDRVKMHIKKNNIDELIRYYIGAQYEIDGGVAGNKERLYLGGDAYSAAVVYVKEAGKWNIYYICRDYLGSITHVTDATGVVKQELSYDAWGRLRNPVDQKLYVEGTEPVLLLGRGYTGHEHLQMFGLINMNARLYDPVIGRFLSPDPYVQAPDWSQNFNRYSYGLNNPLKYTDEDGELFGGIFGAVSGFWKGITNAIKGRGVERIFTDTWKGFSNDIKIDWGLFKGDFKQIVSRFTWELPQTFVGNTYSHIRNITWQVDKVRYFDGATFMINDQAKVNDGISIGNYININIRDKYDKNIFEPDGKFTVENSPLFMHEYGHYLQSQSMGWAYLGKIGIPSLISAMNTKQNVATHNGTPLSSHKIQSFEINANKRAAKYFLDKYGVKWEGGKFNSFPISNENIIKY